MAKSEEVFLITTNYLDLKHSALTTDLGIYLFFSLSGFRGQLHGLCLGWINLPAVFGDLIFGECVEYLVCLGGKLKNIFLN